MGACRYCKGIRNAPSNGSAVEGAFEVLPISAVVSVLVADDGNVAVKV